MFLKNIVIANRYHYFVDHNWVHQAVSITFPAPISTTTTMLSSTMVTSTLEPTTSSTTPSSTTTALSCVVDYTLDNAYNMCYRWYLSPTQYEDAKATCRNEGASLLLVNNLEKQTFGANLISKL